MWSERESFHSESCPVSRAFWPPQIGAISAGASLITKWSRMVATSSRPRKRSEAARQGVSFTHPLPRVVTYDRDGAANLEPAEAQEILSLFSGKSRIPVGLNIA